MSALRIKWHRTLWGDYRADVAGVGRYHIGKSGWCVKQKKYVGRHASWSVSLQLEGRQRRETAIVRRTLAEAKGAATADAINRIIERQAGLEVNP